MLVDSNSRIVSNPDDLTEGLFGGIALFVLQTLPHLDMWNAFPDWSITSRLYGEKPDFQILPGAFDLAYPPPAQIARTVDFKSLMEFQPLALGKDWPGTGALWSKYFRVPDRTVRAVEDFGDLSHSLGVHYRGHDKQTNTWDSNPITREQFAELVADFLRNRPDITSLFVATDDAAFQGALAERIALPMRAPGAGGFLFGLQDGQRNQEADAAVRDCSALSKCAAVIITSSALSAFAKVLNPSLEIYRCAASRLFADIPYFPVAHIPVYKSADPKIAAIIQRSMQADWLTTDAGKRFVKPFISQPRYSLAQKVKKRVSQSASTIKQAVLRR